jgi:DNA-binding response OmpR family regulator
VAHDGLEGFKQARDGDYNLVIMDMMLPKKDGMSVIKDLREGGNRVPVLMLTARDNMEDIVSGLDAGSDDYLTKPFAFAELLARVRALLRRGELDRGAEIRFADLRLDPVSHKVWRGSKEIDLTSKEYGLLEYLMRNHNTVLSRAMIAEHVWDYAFDSFTNIIDVYVNYLRKKIDKDYPSKLIHTVRGQGYILREG